MDESYRNTKQIDATAVAFANPAYLDFLYKTVKNKACAMLGVQSDLASMYAYKLLLYGPGCHFKMHQDTEKMPRHFATVVVVFPSVHTGGQLRLVTSRTRCRQNTHLSHDPGSGMVRRSSFSTRLQVQHTAHPSQPCIQMSFIRLNP